MLPANRTSTKTTSILRNPSMLPANRTSTKTTSILRPASNITLQGHRQHSRPRQLCSRNRQPLIDVAGNQRFHHRVAKVPPPLQFPLERWSINYELRERRTALADWSSDSHHSSANVVLALDPTPNPMPDRRSATKRSPLAGSEPFASRQPSALFSAGAISCCSNSQK
jgi:hypothetical protein